MFTVECPGWKNLVSCCCVFSPHPAGLPHMRAVVGASNMASKAWALQHENKDYSFHLKGSLPFSKVSPQVTRMVGKEESGREWR